MASADFIVGIIGNVVSVLLCASPMGAFWDMTQTKSAVDYNAFPYIAQLLCKTLWTFYGILDPNGLLIITVNAVGVFSQLIYVIIYLIYAPTDKKVKALIFVAIVNVSFPCIVIAVTVLAFHGSNRETFIGVLCAVVTVAMYAAPLSVMWTVIKTKSIKYMPFFLSFFLLLNAGAWFAFALIRNDHFVIVPNALGIISGTAQIIIYMIYKNKSDSVKCVHAIEEGISVEEAKVGSIKVEELTENHKSKIGNRSGSMAEPSREDSFRMFMRTVSSLTSPRDCHSGPLLLLH